MPKKDDAFIKRAHARWKLASEAESTIRRDCLDDLKFSTGDQWPAEIRSQRQLQGKPCLTMDQMQQAIRQVTNEYRQQRPSINVNPVGSDSDVDTAEVLQGCVRHIEVDSDAEIAYDTAHDFVVRGGIGSFRLLTEYTDEDSDDQDIKIVPIDNPFSVYWQPGIPDQAKRGWAFITEDKPIPDYDEERADGDADSKSLIAFCSTGDQAPGWATQEYIRLAEYFIVEDVPRGEGKRPGKKVMWYKINALEILDERELPGSSIPILTCYGDDINVDGTRHVAGMVRNMKDPQRMYNYWCTGATETVALAKTAPWIVVEGQLEGFETLWKNANNTNPTYLPYKQVDVAGKPAPPPQRQVAEPPIQAMQAMIQQARGDLQAGAGLYNASLGKDGPEQSGKAVLARQKQGDVATLNYSDNMARTMRRCGKLLLEWIRVIYDTPRVQRIIKPDQTVQQVIIHNGPEQEDAANDLKDKINQKQQDGPAQNPITRIFDIGAGKYDVTVSVGPSYQTKRQEAVATQMALVQADPQILPIIGDLLVGEMDIPGAKEIAKRLKKMLPPQLQDQDDPASQIQQLQGQHAQMAQELQLLTQHAQQLMQEKQAKVVEQQGKFQIEQMRSNMDFAMRKLDADTKIAIAEIQTKAQIAMERATSLDQIHSDLHESAHELGMQANQQDHEKQMASQQAQNDQQAQSSDQSHDLGMAAAGQAGEQQSQQASQEHEAEMAANAQQSQNGAGS